MTHLLRALLVASLLLPGCATAPAEHALPVPHVYEPLGRDFFLRQNVVARFDSEERRFEVVLESHCDELRLVGLTGFGMRIFSARHSGDGLEVESFAGQPLPFAPARVLRDVERVFFRSPSAPENGERVVVFAGERVVEHWQAGRLQARSIAVSDDPSDPALRIRYSGAIDASGISERVDLSNELFGYSLAIHNHSVSIHNGLERPCVSDDDS